MSNAPISANWGAWKEAHRGLPLLRGATMNRKTVYLNGAAVGSAETWHEVAALLYPLSIYLPVREAQNLGNEGPDGFFLTIHRQVGT
jgi:hypothetical protein